MLWTSLACSPSAGAERVVALENEPVAAEPTNEVALGFGRVVDEQGAPVSGATVELWQLDQLLAGAVSGADGRFEMRGSPPVRRENAHATLTALGPAGSFALRIVRDLPLGRRGASLADLDPRGANWCELILEPTHTLDVRVVGAEGPVTITAGALTYQNRRTLDHLRVRAADTARLLGLPSGVIPVFASDEKRGGYAEVRVPMESRVEVQLGVLRIAEVEVVDETTGEPLVCAEVSAFRVSERTLAPHAVSWPTLVWVETTTTDDDGVARFSGLEASGLYEFHANVPGYEWAGHPDGTWGWYPRLAAGEERVRYLVRPSDFGSRSLRMLTDPSEAPPHGSIVQIFDPESTGIAEGDAPLALGRIEQEHLVAELPWPMDVRRLVARAPDGSLAWLDVFQEDSSGQRSVSPLSFGAPQAIDVRVLDASGNACSDLAVAVVGQSIKRAPPWSTVLRTDISRVYAWTDSTGTARFEGLPPLPLVARVQHRDFPYYAVEVGPAYGEASLNAIWHPPFRAIATVTVDGHVGLPEGLAWAPFYPRAHLDEGRLLFELPVPDAGESTTIVASAPGLSIANASLKPAADGSTVHFRLDLERGNEVTVLCPRFRDVELVPERFDSEQNLWAPLVGTTSHIVTMNEQCTQRRIEGLRAGRWRMRDKQSGAVSTEVELGPDNRAGFVTLLGQ
jgi:hypothetical protein